jgi:vitamin B12 transporter
MNVSRARVRGVESAADLTWLGIRWRGSVTLQRARDEDTGTQLQGRAQRFATLEAARTLGAWTLATQVVASGERHDSIAEAAGTRLPGYARVDARVRYALDKRWTVEVSAVNVLDKRYEHALGYDGTRRGALVSVRFDAF